VCAVRCQAELLGYSSGYLKTPNTSASIRLFRTQKTQAFKDKQKPDVKEQNNIVFVCVRKSLIVVWSPQTLTYYILHITN
jgi:hypothetical protein